MSAKQPELPMDLSGPTVAKKKPTWVPQFIPKGKVIIWPADTSPGYGERVTIVHAGGATRSVEYYPDTKEPSIYHSMRGHYRITLRSGRITGLPMWRIEAGNLAAMRRGAK
jgi:hypothetical protein